MNDPNITMEEYIRLEEEKARRNGKVYNWETATYGKNWYDEDVYDLRSVENEFSAIVFDDVFTSEVTPSYEPTVSIRRILWYGYAVSTSCTVLVIKESLVKTKQKGAILELKRRHLKNIIFCYYTPYLAMKIRRISASLAQEKRNDQFPIRRITLHQHVVCTAVHQSKIRI
uniref:Uncharacterized protein n=1 Tax=Tanacetum cinerariifolium TaxID=118510 RepID=A0A6L2MR41_TANCI|nr:hypothetical protein [Tanacetum cinerariifolium]